MNKTKIEWCDMSWNPVTGCLHGCEYCYARRMAKRFSRGTGKGVNPPAYYIPGAGYIRDTEHNSFIENANIHVVKWPMYDEWIIREGEYNYRYDPFPYGFEPTFHRYRLDEPAKKTKGSKVFVCSMADLFGDWVPEEWILKVLDACKAAPQHKYLFLTKNPKRYLELEKKRLLPWEDNFWFGTSVTKPDDDFAWFREKKFHWFISMEPLLEGIDITTGSGVILPEWVIIGAETGNRKGKVVPEREWLSKIIEDCRTYNIPVFMKDSLIPIVGERNMRREFPEGLKK